MSLIIKRYVCSICEPQRELGRVVVFIYKGNSSATAESKLLVTGGSGGLTSSLARQHLTSSIGDFGSHRLPQHPCAHPSESLATEACLQ